MMVMSSRLSLTAGASSRRPSSTARASRMASTPNMSMSTTGAAAMSVHHAHDVRRVHVLAQVADGVVLDLDDPRVAVVVVVAVAQLAVGLGLGADQIAGAERPLHLDLGVARCEQAAHGFQEVVDDRIAAFGLACSRHR